MNSNDFEPVIKFNREEQVEATSNILGTVVRSVFVAFMKDGGGMSDDEIDELLTSSVDMASISMAVAGMDIVGENINGDYIVNFRPYSSIEEFTKENEWRVKNV